MLKHKKVIVPLLLAIAGCAYFTAYSNLETNFLVNAGLIIVPLQAGGCLYLLYLYWRGQIPGTSRYRQRHPSANYSRPNQDHQDQWVNGQK